TSEEELMAFPEPRAPRRLTVLATALATAALAFTSIGVAAQGETSLGSNYSDEVPRTAMADTIAFCEASAGITVATNTVDHGTFQDQLNSYLQATPDDVFTWFAGFRMRFFADQGLATPVTDVWDKVGDNYSEAFKAASTGNDGEQYFIPIYNYPWVVLYRKSLFEENGYTVPTTFEDFVTLAEQADADGLVPLAFADKDGWPAMGTFDILNMRLNGYEFHVGLMAGTESWTDERVTSVFEVWRDDILPYSQRGALGRTWQEAAQSLLNKEAAMYFLGTFAAEQFPSGDQADLDFFPFPTLGTEFDDELAIDAPIDGFMLSKDPRNPDAAKAFLECLSSGAAQIIYLTGNPAAGVAAGNDADTSGYTELQQKSAEIIANSGRIAQFLDRDTRPDFAGPNGMQGFLQDFLQAPDQDLAALQSGIQDFWDSLPPLQ
ncbi:MAG: ABC transporter substrate-binding protein, partial [Chloroflexota bacterium]